jgi:hypothetical protein
VSGWLPLLLVYGLLFILPPMLLLTARTVLAKNLESRFVKLTSAMPESRDQALLSGLSPNTETLC